MTRRADPRIPYPEVWSKDGKISGLESLVEQGAKALAEFGRRTAKIGYLCGEDLLDYFYLPLLWNLFPELLVVRAKASRDLTVFIEQGWSFVVTNEVAARNRFAALEPILGLDRSLLLPSTREASQCPETVHIATSGTTGPCRYVSLPKANVIDNALASYDSFLGTIDGTLLIPSFSLGSSYGFLMQLVTPCVCRLRIYGQMIGKFANPILNCHGNHSFTIVLSPAQLHNCVLRVQPNERRRLDHIGSLSLICGGDFLYPSTASRVFDRLGDVTLFHTYGLTELGPRVSTRAVRPPIDESSIGQVGKPIPGVDVLAPLRTSVSGVSPEEVVVDTPYGGWSYIDGRLFRDRASTVAHTGDEGYFTPDGNLTILGRLNAAKKSNLILRQLENCALEQLPLVQCEAEFAEADKIIVKIRSRQEAKKETTDAMINWSAAAKERFRLVGEPALELG